MLHRRCCVFRTPVFPPRTFFQAPHQPLQSLGDIRAQFRASRASPPAQLPCSCSRICLSSPALLRLLYPGRRDITILARKQAADGGGSAQSCDEPSLPSPTAAEDAKPAKKAARKKKADTASPAAQQDTAASQLSTHHSADPTAASALSTENAVGGTTLDEPAASGEPKPVKKRRRKKQVLTTEPSEHDNKLTSLQNGRPSIDLHANAPEGSHWHNVKSWVAFSDLHVGLRTVDVACQVLRRVKEEAAARNAGILFLGRTSRIFAG